MNNKLIRFIIGFLVLPVFTAVMMGFVWLIGNYPTTVGVILGTATCIGVGFSVMDHK